ncbi:MAG: hypothetical protein IJ228_11705 [Succinivibrio sp.]|nr:hypothetical protein [Succinivibrio sp.]
MAIDQAGLNALNLVLNQSFMPGYKKKSSNLTGTKNSLLGSAEFQQFSAMQAKVSEAANSLATETAAKKAFMDKLDTLKEKYGLNDNSSEAKDDTSDLVSISSTAIDRLNVFLKNLKSEQDAAAAKIQAQQDAALAKIRSKLEALTGKSAAPSTPGEQANTADNLDPENSLSTAHSSETTDIESAKKQAQALLDEVENSRLPEYDQYRSAADNSRSAADSAEGSTTTISELA